MDNLAEHQAGISHAEIELGARLKIIREHNGLSQRELAKRAGVPHSSISTIEQGQSSPSISSLTKILSGIPMSIAQFFSCDTQDLRAQIFRADFLRNQQQIPNRGMIVQSVPLKTRSPIRFERVSYLAHYDSGEVPLHSTSALSGFILSGKIELTLNAEFSVLCKGDAFALSAMQPYRLKNADPSDDCVIMLCAYS